MAHYNDSGNRGCRIGNWVEEGVLEKVTGVARYNAENPRGNDTFARLILHDKREEPSEYKSNTHDHYVKPSPRTSPQIAQGPRERIRNEALRRIASQIIQNEIKESQVTTSCGCMINPVEAPEPVPKVTEVQSQFKAHKIDSTVTRISRGCTTRPKLPPGCKDNVPLDQPITFYTQNLIEGNLFASPSDSIASAFHKNTIFSTRAEVNGDDHAEDLITDDYPTEIVDRTCSMTAGASSDITIRRLVSQAAKAIGEQGGLTVSRLLGGESSGNQEVNPRTLSTALLSFKLPLNARQVRALVLCFGGESADEIVSVFNLPSDNTCVSGGGDKAVPGSDSSRPTGLLRVWFTKRDLQPNDVQLEVDPVRVGRLSLPKDEPVLRALLRKVHRVVPFSVDRLEYV